MAREKGMDLIITDHHEVCRDSRCLRDQPEAAGLSLSEKELAGVGLAYSWLAVAGQKAADLYLTWWPWNGRRCGAPQENRIWLKRAWSFSLIAQSARRLY